MRPQNTASVEELTNTLDLILDTVTDHAHWQLFRGYNGYRITVFLDTDFDGAPNTDNASGTVYLEKRGASESLSEALTATTELLLDAIAAVYNDAERVAA